MCCLRRNPEGIGSLLFLCLLLGLLGQGGALSANGFARVKRLSAVVPFQASLHQASDQNEKTSSINHLGVSHEVFHHDPRTQTEIAAPTVGNANTQVYQGAPPATDGMEVEGPSDKTMILGISSVGVQGNPPGVAVLSPAATFQRRDFPPPGHPAGLAPASNGPVDVDDLKSQLASLQIKLNQSDLIQKTITEFIRLMQNNNEVLKLENAQINRLYNDEKLKARMHYTALMQTKKILTEVQTRLNETEGTGKNISSWDVRETVYNGEAWLQNWDGREPPLGVPSNVTATRMILLLRHGHYEYSEPEEFIKMSALGTAQMEALGQGLKSLNYNWSKTFVHSSKYRTKHAAEIVNKYLPNLTLEPSHIIWSCAYDNDSDRRQEAFKQFIHRAAPEQKHTSYELIMTHSSIIRYFLDRAMQIPFGTISMPLVHGSISRIEIPPDGRVVLREYGEYSHMPRNLLTASNAKWLPSDLGTTAPPLPENATKIIFW